MLFRIVGCGLAIVTCSACQEKEARPDTISICDEGCKPADLSRPAAGLSPSATSSSSTSGGSSDAVVDFAGNLSLFLDDSFSVANLSLYTGTASVFLSDAKNGVLEARYDGTRFSFEGLDAMISTQVLIAPDDLNGLAMPTLLRLGLTESVEVSLPLVNSDALSLIFNTVTSQVTVDPERGHIVMQFVDANLEPISGVQVEIPGAEFVAYAEGASWNDAAGETSDQGLVVAGNVPAAAFPGSLVPIALSGSVQVAEVQTVVRGTATYDVIQVL